MGVVRTHLPGSPTSRISAAINRETQSSRNESVAEGLAAAVAFDELENMMTICIGCLLRVALICRR